MVNATKCMINNSLEIRQTMEMVNNNMLPTMLFTSALTT